MRLRQKSVNLSYTVHAVKHSVVCAVDETGIVCLINYEESPAGLIQSFVDRFRNDANIENILEQLSQADCKHFDMCLA